VKRTESIGDEMRQPGASWGVGGSIPVKVTVTVELAEDLNKKDSEIKGRKKPILRGDLEKDILTFMLRHHIKEGIITIKLTAEATNEDVSKGN